MSEANTLRQKLLMGIKGDQKIVNSTDLSLDVILERLYGSNADAILDAVLTALPEHKEVVEAKTEFGIAMNWANPRYNQAIDDVKALLVAAKSQSQKEGQ